MKFVKVIGLALVSLAVASAAAYKVELTSPTKVGSTELKPGNYKVEMAGDKAVFKAGKDMVVEVPATVETAKVKYSNTALDTSNDTLRAILVGGTNMKIVLSK